ncbi:MAG TPA: NFACT family protein [Candidatus Nanoarchaeia archaeon]|nr:NFACT family protein [Candidatus Nanoarchaeia archaeon]
MKREFSAIELHYLVDELKELCNSRVDKIYQPKEDEILIQTHKTGAGKRILRISGKLMYLTEHKSESPQTPFGFCTYLRKKLSNSIIKDISQIGSERIVQIVFDAKGAMLKMVIELFGAGNTILVNDHDVILSPLNIQKFKDREVRPGQAYTYPGKEHSLFEISAENLGVMLRKSSQESVVKALALDLGIGGNYSEEICMQGRIDKNRKPDSLLDKEINDMHSDIRGLLGMKPSPLIVLKDNVVIDIIPFDLKIYHGLEKQPRESYNSAIDSVVTVHAAVKEKAEKEKVANKELERIKKSIQMQEKNIEKLRKEAEENQRKGEIVYENYALVKDVIDELNKAKQKYSWPEIKEKLKGHKTIKSIDEKDKKVVIEI